MEGAGVEIKPQAVVIPKETDQLEQGKYGPVFPRTPACYGFTIIAKVKPGRADVMRSYGYALAEALEKDPYLLAPLKLHYLRWVLFDDDTRFMYQGIFDTGFDKYTTAWSGAELPTVRHCQKGPSKTTGKTAA
jgi:hypothetical protein